MELRLVDRQNCQRCGPQMMKLKIIKKQVQNTLVSFVPRSFNTLMGNPGTHHLVHTEKQLDKNTGCSF